MISELSSTAKAVLQSQDTAPPPFSYSAFIRNHSAAIPLPNGDNAAFAKTVSQLVAQDKLPPAGSRKKPPGNRWRRKHPSCDKGRSSRRDHKPRAA